jgi:hypothetical protein
MPVSRPLIRRPKTPPAHRTAKSGHLPAPLGGINSSDSAQALPSSDCIYLYNLSPAENGLRSRFGSIQQATLALSTGPVVNDTGEVRTVIPFKGAAADGTQDRLFVCTANGIYDVTTPGADQIRVATFGTTTGLAGYGVSTSLMAPSGGVILYTDEVNGYYVYTAGTDTWDKVASGGGAGQISGADPANFVFVMVWKNRVWFVKRDGDACYLPVGQFAGAVADYTFGSKFQHGGHLVGLWNCTLDGGAGVDDHLIAIGSSGDVLIYTGTDPGDPYTFNLRGSWYAGAVPPGRRIATDFGGDVVILTTMGALPISKLTRGSTITDPDLYATRKVSVLFSRLMATRKDSLGWSIKAHPEDNSVIITIPRLGGDPPQQLAISLSTKAWARYRDLPIFSCEAWNGKLYYGTVNGQVWINTGYLDNITLTNPVPKGIFSALLSSFQNFSNGNVKRVQTIRPVLVWEGRLPTYLVEARYDFDLTEVLTVPQELNPTVPLTWDSTAWDEAVWGGTAVSRRITGARGMGAAIAIAFRCISYARMALVGFDITWDEGGVL